MTTANKLMRLKTDFDDIYNKGYEQGKTEGAKEEQEKSITITENGTTEITPDDNKVLSKVTVEVNVADSFYDAFWDAYQMNGELVDYNYSFASGRFSSRSFYPKYDIRPTKSAYSMMSNFPDELDLIQRLKDCGVVLDTTGCPTVANMFAYSSYITTVPTIDASNSAGMQEIFANCAKLHTVEKLIMSSKVTNNWNAFGNCVQLKNIIFEGEIASNISFASCSQLSMESVDSIGACCIDLTGQDSQTVTFHKDVIAKMSDEQKAVFTNKNWTIASSK